MTCMNTPFHLHVLATLVLHANWLNTGRTLYDIRGVVFWLCFHYTGNPHLHVGHVM